MRSLLFVPADGGAKLEKAFRAGADAMILDLEDSVASARKEEARRSALGFLKAHRAEEKRPRLYVRINALSTPLAAGDLDVVMTGAPDGIMLPKAGSGGDVTLLDAKLSVREALHGVEDGATKIVVLATESAAAIFTLGTYRGASRRLAGLTWGAEDLGAETGALETRLDGAWTEPNRLVRSLALFAATAAGVQPIDAVYADFRDLDGLKRDCAEGRRFGFLGKLAIHPDQIEPINEAFTPSAEAVARAQAIVAAFAAAENAGVTSLDGRMLDIPHLKAAERLLASIAKPAPAAEEIPETPSPPDPTPAETEMADSAPPPEEASEKAAD